MKKHLTFAFALLTLICTSAHAQLPSYLPADGLVGWWPFNGNANDESGNGNDGVVNGAVLTEDRNGLSLSAYDFNGTSSRIEVADDVTLDLTAFSISAWVYLPQYNPLADEILTKGSDLNENYEILIYGGQNDAGNIETAIRWTNGSRSGINSGWGNAQVQTNSWTHIVTQYDFNNGVLKMFINGVEVTQVSSNLTPSNNSSNLSIGFDPAVGRYHLGRIDDIAIYNRALTIQEIQNLYTATNTGNTVDTGNGAAPLPQGIPYQAAARDANGQPVADSPVNVRFSLREGAADGAASYIESHSLTTNSVGLFNTVFGNGTPVQSAFDSINWAATTKFLQVEVDLGNGYVDMGTTQLLSVPYAFRSAQAANIKNAALPIYPNNAAALAGGLVAGEMYRTANGDLKIVY